jgi:bacillithiol system protein YtxJ
MDIKTLETEAHFDEALAASGERPVLLFKHSLTCPISANAYKEVRRFVEGDGAEADVRMIVVQDARPVAERAADVLGIRHESPQAIVVRDGKPVWDASHFKITSKALAQALEAA